MIAWSELRNFGVVAPGAGPGRLLDAAIEDPEADNPCVSHLRARLPGGPPTWLAWAAVAAVDWDRREIRLAEPPSAAPGAEPPPDNPHLEAEVLDALVIDLEQRQLTRANDLWLEPHAGRLQLCGVDTRLSALLRRVLPGRRAPQPGDEVRPWKYVEYLRGDPAYAGALKAGWARVPAAGGRLGEAGRITHLPAGEIASLTFGLPYLHVAELLSRLPPGLAADTLESLPAARQLQVFEELPEPQALRLLALLAPDVAADLVGRLATELARAYLNRLPRQAAERIIELLRYPEDSVGGIMTNDIVWAPAGLTAGQARDQLRDRLKEPDFVYFVYVVDNPDDRRLLGVISLRDLLVAEDNLPLAEAMNPYVLTLGPLDNPRVAAYRLLEAQLAAMPVIGQHGRLLGTVTVDAAVAQVAPRQWSTQAPRVFS